MCTSTMENPSNLSVYQIIEIFSTLYSTYLVFRDQDKFVFYSNNYINWDQFSQLYDLDWMEKSIRNADAVARKLGPALTRVINYSLEVARKERQKREEIMIRSRK